MAWGRSKSPSPRPLPVKPERSPDEIISEMLSAYQSHFYEKQKGGPPPGIEEARALVERAKQIISDSRIGYSLCAISDHIRPWPAWVKRDDFQQHAGFPATNVSGFQERANDRGTTTRTTTQFTYRDTPYTLVFEDEGIPMYSSDDMNAYGKINLYLDGSLIVGIDVSADRSREYDRRHFTNVSAFNPGDWMKHVVEMAAYIDAKQSQQLNSFFDDDALKRAAKINLYEARALQRPIHPSLLSHSISPFYIPLLESDDPCFETPLPA